MSLESSVVEVGGAESFKQRGAGVWGDAETHACGRLYEESQSSFYKKKREGGGGGMDGGGGGGEKIR